MKIKDKNNFENSDLYDEMRYNPNTVGNALSIKDGECNMDKRETAAMSIFSLMTICGYFDAAKAEVSDKSLPSIASKMIDNATKIVDNTFVKDESSEWGITL